MIEVRNLSKVYALNKNPFHALKNVSLSIQDGESVAIMGKSGAGKTTLLHILGCLDKFDTGEVSVDGVSLAGLHDAQLAKMRNERIGFVLQDFALIHQKSVLFNAALPLYFDKTPSGKIKKKAMEVLEMVGLGDQAKKKVSALSGGEKQRVAIARAMIKRPKLILADEPTGALDSATSKIIMETLLAMNEQGVTLILVTHDADVAAFCKRKITLSDGALVADENLDTASGEKVVKCKDK